GGGAHKGQNKNQQQKQKPKIPRPRESHQRFNKKKKHPQQQKHEKKTVDIESYNDLPHFHQRTQAVYTDGEGQISESAHRRQ
ncbi:hypothetical protein ACQWHS_25065, partial [Salmonella enterica subsp. enterica serovar Infantis]